MLTPDNNSSADPSIERAIESLTLEQKVRLLSGAAHFATAGEPDIELGPMVLSDGPTGVRGPVVVGGRQSCLLPNATLLAQSWSDDVLRGVGNLLAEEAIDQHTHLVLGPTINLHRSPLGGRLFEAFSEDPYLTGRLAAGYITGLQERGIGSSAKHFLGNESETERRTVDVRIDDATLREVYLKPFEIAVDDANPWTLMAAYNQINGSPSTEQRDLLEDIVKGEWGYDGLVMSDWDATSSTVESVTAGLDLVMPGPKTPWNRTLIDEVRAGTVSETVVDEHLRRYLRLAVRVGAFGEKRVWAVGLPDPASAERRAQLKEMAARGMVVLKNTAGVLPLHAENAGEVVVVGRHATDTIVQGGGSAIVRPPHVVTIADALQRQFDLPDTVFFDGVETRIVLPAVDPRRIADPVTGEPGARLRAYDSRGQVIHEEHLEIAELEDSKSGWQEHATQFELSVRLLTDEPTDVQLGARGPGKWRVTAPGHDEQFEIPFHPGPGGGFFRPKSHATTVRIEPGSIITATAERTDLARILGIVVAPPRRAAASTIAAAANAARAADTAIVVVGNTSDQETEGEDKHTLALPGHQDALVTAVASAAKRTVVIVNASTPVLMPWADMVDAILFVGLPGQEAGDAVTAALTGEILPEGRLVTSFPSADRTGPAWSTDPSDGVLEYTEGKFLGYRGWYRDGQLPAFWFGHGLGYTEWEYSDTTATWWPDGVPSTVQVNVRNTGAFEGIETVQVYFEPTDADQPVRLIGWEQVALEPGSSSTVAVDCDVRMLRAWDAAASAWVPLLSGRVLVGRSLGDVRATIDTADLSPVDGATEPSERIEV